MVIVIDFLHEYSDYNQSIEHIPGKWISSISFDLLAGCTKIKDVKEIIQLTFICLN